jgi:crotonobetainyl-CoA:carnitine CoA-transferase CaiB-like acyl-CoA transferase
MTHGSHRFVSHRVAGDPRPHLLTGGLACYRIYETADGRWLTLAALEAHFFERLCALLERPDLASLQFADDQQSLGDELAAIFVTRTLAEWLERFDAEDVAVGPVATLAEAADDLGTDESPQPVPRLGQHTEAWRTELDF